MRKTLNPCPSCGGEGRLAIINSEKAVVVSCHDCGVMARAIEYKDHLSTEDILAAINAWNDRIGIKEGR